MTKHKSKKCVKSISCILLSLSLLANTLSGCSNSTPEMEVEATVTESKATPTETGETVAESETVLPETEETVDKAETEPIETEESVADTQTVPVETEESAIDTTEDVISTNVTEPVIENTGPVLPTTGVFLGLTDTQRNSISMLNYLTVLVQDIRASKNSRIYLEETYSSIVDNTDPNAIDNRTLGQLTTILNTLENYRMIAVKRDRLLLMRKGLWFLRA